MAKRKINVRSYKRRDGTPVKGYTKEIDEFYGPLSEGWVESINKKDMTLSEDEWAMAHFGSSEPHPSYEEYLNNLKGEKDGKKKN